MRQRIAGDAPFGYRAFERAVAERRHADDGAVARVERGDLAFRNRDLRMDGMRVEERQDGLSGHDVFARIRAAAADHAVERGREATVGKILGCYLGDRAGLCQFGLRFDILDFGQTALVIELLQTSHGILGLMQRGLCRLVGASQIGRFQFGEQFAAADAHPLAHRYALHGSRNGKTQHRGRLLFDDADVFARLRQRVGGSRDGSNADRPFPGSLRAAAASGRRGRERCEERRFHPVILHGSDFTCFTRYKGPAKRRGIKVPDVAAVVLKVENR